MADRALRNRGGLLSVNAMCRKEVSRRQRLVTFQGSALDRITAQSESGGREYDGRGNRITSPVGARGIMQVMPGTARDPGFGIRPSDGTPAEDARVGREYRAKMQKRYGGDLAKMWAAYNWGPGNLDSALRRHGENWFANAPAETRAYVSKNIRALGGQ